MGSLVGGWDTLKHARGLEPSRSFTEDEIELFWKSRRQQQVEEIHQPDLATSPRTQALHIMEEDSLSVEEKKKLANNWWRRSNSAFLNDLPDEEMKGSKYTAQFDVAQRARAGNDMTSATA